MPPLDRDRIVRTEARMDWTRAGPLEPFLGRWFRPR